MGLVDMDRESFLTTVEGSLFQHKIIIFPSKFVTCHAHILHDSFVSHVETTFQHV